MTQNTSPSSRNNSASVKPKALRIKVCGMKSNTADVSRLQPDYLGFIFYDKSPRNFELQQMPSIPEGVKKAGVFVNAEIDFILEKVQQFNFDVIQLHGSETPDFCMNLKKHLAEVVSELHQPVKIWKVFSIKDAFDFSVLESYEAVVDAFLFDTKGKEKGGNGYTFDWNVLKAYSSKKPFVLSGGIGLEEIESVKKLIKLNLPLYAIDVNSKFEIEPGLKNTADLSDLFSAFRNNK